MTSASDLYWGVISEVPSLASISALFADHLPPRGPAMMDNVDEEHSEHEESMEELDWSSLSEFPLQYYLGRNSKVTPPSPGVVLTYSIQTKSHRVQPQ